jgi:hypothetical protein
MASSSTLPPEVLASFAPATDPANTPICYVNGKRYELPLGRGEGTLLQFLRGKRDVIDSSCFWAPATTNLCIFPIKGIIVASYRN